MPASKLSAANEGLFRYSVSHFLAALVVSLAAVPLLEGMDNGRAIEGVLMTLVLCSAVVAVGGRRRTLLAALALLVPAVVSRWVDQFRPDLVAPELTHLVAMAFVAFVAARLLHFILTAPQVNSEVLCAAIAVFLLFGLIWAFAYGFVSWHLPDAFVGVGVGDGGLRGFAALYFSFVTLTTVGYGDIIPAAPIARLLAISESTCGMLYMTILIARLVALYSGRSKE